MSIYKYWWHPNVVRAIRQCPALVSAKEDKQTQFMTAENIALRQLPDREEEIICAVGKAIEEINHHADGPEVLAIVKLVDWDRTNGVEDAAIMLHMSERTARSRRNRFIYAVAKYMGYL